MSDKRQRVARLTHKGRLLWILQGKKTDLYVVDRTTPDPALAWPAFRLTKADGTVYTVALTKAGPTCCCADANFRQRKCKHILSLRAVGLLVEDDYAEGDFPP